MIHTGTGNAYTGISITHTGISIPYTATTVYIPSRVLSNRMPCCLMATHVWIESSVPSLYQCRRHSVQSIDSIRKFGQHTINESPVDLLYRCSATDLQANVKCLINYPTGEDTPHSVTFMKRFGTQCECCACTQRFDQCQFHP